MNLKKMMLVGLSAFMIVAMLAGCVATPPPVVAMLAAVSHTAAAAEEAAAPAEGEEAAAPAAGEEQITLRWANIIDADADENGGK